MAGPRSMWWKSYQMVPRNIPAAAPWKAKRTKVSLDILKIWEKNMINDPLDLEWDTKKNRHQNELASLHQKKIFHSKNSNQSINQAKVPTLEQPATLKKGELR